MPSLSDELKALKSSKITLLPQTTSTLEGEHACTSRKPNTMKHKSWPSPLHSLCKHRAFHWFLRAVKTAIHNFVTQNVFDALKFFNKDIPTKIPDLISF